MAASLVEAAQRGQDEFAAPAQRIEACAEALRRASVGLASDVEALGVEELERQWDDWQADKATWARHKEASAWTRQRLERALDPTPWGALDRDEEHTTTALQRLIGLLEREPEHPDRMVWLGQARGHVEALERHRAAVHRAHADARRALLDCNPATEPDVERLEVSLRRSFAALRSASVNWLEHARAAENAAAEAVATLPDVEWWAEELGRLSWELELRLVQDGSGEDFESRIAEVLQRQSRGETPAAVALARSVERLETRVGEQAEALQRAASRIERLLRPS